MREHRLFMFQQPVVAAIELVALGQPGILAQQIGQRGALEPLAVQPLFAARRQQPVGHQNKQDLIPARAFAARIQSLRLARSFYFHEAQVIDRAQ
jgi:hypothetical protein